jgi:hypothetical protein
MKLAWRGMEIEVERGTHYVRVGDLPPVTPGGRPVPDVVLQPDGLIELYVENDGDPQESVTPHLTPAEARQLAAELVRLADEIEQE